MLNDDLVTSNDTYVAQLPSAVQVFELWKNKTPVKRIVAPLGESLPDRESLSDNDEDFWKPTRMAEKKTRGPGLVCLA